MRYLALLLAKITMFFGKLLNRGSALPGKIAMKLEPKILSYVKFPQATIFITGTNGKTGSSFFTARLFKTANYRVVTNAEGANMMQGIITAVLKNIRFDFKLNADYCVLEVDEATLPKLLAYVKPSHIAMTNLFPDQEDRYGGVDRLQKLLSDCIPEDVTLVLNGNDARLVAIGDDNLSNKKVYYGIAEESFDEPHNAISCPNCGKQLNYTANYYEHLGFFECECGIKTPKLDYVATNVNLKDSTYELNGNKICMPYDKLFFVHNTLLACSVGLEFGLTIDELNAGLSGAKIGMGRMDKVRFGDKLVQVNMAKNIAGFNQSISDVCRNMKEPYVLYVAVNNRIADGVDTSWLNNVAFEKLSDNAPQRYIVGGEASDSIVNALKGAGVADEKISVSDISAMAALVEALDCEAYIIANYTAMTEILSHSK